MRKTGWRRWKGSSWIGWGQYEAETVAYMALPNATGTYASNDAVIRAIKATGVTYAGTTLKTATVALGALLTQPAFDWRLFSEEVWGVGRSPKITLTDTGAKIAVFYGGNAGTGETFSAERATPLINSPTNAFDTFAADGQNITSAISINGKMCGAASMGNNLGDLLKISAAHVINSGTVQLYLLPGLAGGSPQILLSAALSSGAFEVYVTIPADTVDAIVYYSNTSVNFTASAVSGKKVLTPSALGITIKNAAGAQSYQSIDAGFLPNATSFTAVVERR